MSAALSESPRIANSTRAAWRSLEIWSALPASYGDPTFWTSSSFEILATTSATPALKAGSVADSDRLWTRTLSSAGFLKPASRILSIRPDSPGPGLFGSIDFMPARPPSPKATITNASQPKVAVFQWSALQRPIRAARLLDLVGVIIFLLALRTPELTLGARPRKGIVKRPDSGSDQTMISTPTQVGGGE